MESLNKEHFRTSLLSFVRMLSSKFGRLKFTKTTHIHGEYILGLQTVSFVERLCGRSVLYRRVQCTCLPKHSKYHRSKSKHLNYHESNDRTDTKAINSKNRMDGVKIPQIGHRLAVTLQERRRAITVNIKQHAHIIPVHTHKQQL